MIEYQLTKTNNYENRIENKKPFKNAKNRGIDKVY